MKIVIIFAIICVSCGVYGFVDRRRPGGDSFPRPLQPTFPKNGGQWPSGYQRSSYMWDVPDGKLRNRRALAEKFFQEGAEENNVYERYPQPADIFIEEPQPIEHIREVRSPGCFGGGGSSGKGHGATGGSRGNGGGFGGGNRGGSSRGSVGGGGRFKRCS